MSLPTSEKGYASQDDFWTDLAKERTPELRWPKSIQVYNRMRSEEGKVTSVLKAVTLPLLRTNWWIDPAGARSRVVKQISEDLGLPIAGQKARPAARTRDRFSWTEHLRLALLMLPHGHSVFEQNYRIVNGQARLRKLGWRPPQTISKIDVAADGGLKAVHQWSRTDGGALTAREVEMKVDRLVFYAHDREGGDWLGRSLLRPAYKYWLLKDRALRTMAQVTERSGNGVPWYTASEHPEGLEAEELKAREDAEIAAGLAAAKAYRAGSSSGGAGPHGSKMELLSVGKLPDTLAWINYCDSMMAESVLANFLNLGGDNSTGSYALSDTFADFFVSSLQATSNQVCETASQHIVEDLVDANYGPDEPAPRIVADEIGSKHPATAQALQLLAQVGLITPDEPTERWVRSIHGMPEPDPDTRRTLTGTQAAPDTAPDNPTEETR